MDLLTEMDMKMSKGNFPYFFQNILGYELADFHQEWLDLVNSTQRTVIICSRDHGKSVFFHAWAVYQLIFQEPPYQMLYISSNQKQTMVHMKDIDRMFTNIPALRKYKPKSGWAVGSMRLTNGNEILERSVGSQIRGLHPQEIIIDDPMKEFTIAAIQRVTDWFWGDMIPTLHHTASLRMVGTPFTYTDIFAELEENSEYSVNRYPAINQHGEALWSSRWDIDSLERRRKEIGSSKFTREYLCIPISSNTMLFAKEHIDKSKDRTEKLLWHGKENMKYYIGYDPSLSADGDYTVMIVIEVDEDMNKKVVHMVREKNVDFRSHITRISDLCQRFKPEVVMIETNTFAKSFSMELRDISDFPVRDFTMSRKKKEEIILNLQMNLENGKIIFPYADDAAKGVSNAIIQELEAFGISTTGKIEGLGAHDDCVIALALANHATKSFNDAFVDVDEEGLFASNVVSSNPYMGGGIYGINF
tara:strand:- start:817 stop:2238 length:1422 start_codon:yes stop_codon:yes gene_type:complete